MILQQPEQLYLIDGNDTQKQNLRERFGELPFTVFNANSGEWQRRKKQWLNLGIKSEIGRKEEITYNTASLQWTGGNTSVFDPHLTETLYHFFCPEGGKILDPFAGGSVRGIVANYLGYKYTGIDLRKEQIEANINNANQILDAGNIPNWICGDSNAVLDGITDDFDFVLSCPPYADLERYSDDPKDLSTMDYNNFLIAYESIISKTCKRLKKGCFCAWVVGEVRDKNGNYYGLVPDTIDIFRKCGMKYYNEAILFTVIGTAAMRYHGFVKSRKLVKTHQNILIFNH